MVSVVRVVLNLLQAPAVKATVVPRVAAAVRPVIPVAAAAMVEPVAAVHPAVREVQRRTMVTMVNRDPTVPVEAMVSAAATLALFWPAATLPIRAAKALRV